MYICLHIQFGWDKEKWDFFFVVFVGHSEREMRALWRRLYTGHIWTIGAGCGFGCRLCGPFHCYSYPWAVCVCLCATLALVCPGDTACRWLRDTVLPAITIRCRYVSCALDFRAVRDWVTSCWMHTSIWCVCAHGYRQVYANPIHIVQFHRRRYAHCSGSRYNSLLLLLFGEWNMCVQQKRRQRRRRRQQQQNEKIKLNW